MTDKIWKRHRNLVRDKDLRTDGDYCISSYVKLWTDDALISVVKCRAICHC